MKHFASLDKMQPAFRCVAGMLLGDLVCFYFQEAVSVQLHLWNPQSIKILFLPARIELSYRLNLKHSCVQTFSSFKKKFFSWKAILKLAV